MNNIKLAADSIIRKIYAAHSVSVSAVEILFASNISMIEQESSWQRVRYYLEVVIN